MIWLVADQPRASTTLYFAFSYCACCLSLLCCISCAAHVPAVWYCIVLLFWLLKWTVVACYLLLLLLYWCCWGCGVFYAAVFCCYISPATEQFCCWRCLLHKVASPHADRFKLLLPTSVVLSDTCWLYEPVQNFTFCVSLHLACVPLPFVRWHWNMWIPCWF